MSVKDKADFWCDVREIDMTMMHNNMFYGLQRHIMKIDLPDMQSGFNQIIQRNQF